MTLLVPQYVRWNGDGAIPAIANSGTLKVLIVIEKEMTGTQELDLARALIDAQAFFVCAWGLKCERMHDTVDDASLEREHLEQRLADEVPVVMTTWHSQDSLEAAFWFFRELATHPEVKLKRSLIVHVSDNDRSEEFVALHDAASAEDLR